jgi:hypothetical protein
VGHWSAKEKTMERIAWSDIINVPSFAGQEPHVLCPLNRLAFPEFIHLRVAFDMCLCSARQGSFRCGSVQW